jgi:hypothetical protein
MKPESAALQSILKAAPAPPRLSDAFDRGGFVAFDPVNKLGDSLDVRDQGAP